MIPGSIRKEVHAKVPALAEQECGCGRPRQ